MRWHEPITAQGFGIRFWWKANSWKISTDLFSTDTMNTKFWNFTLILIQFHENQLQNKWPHKCQLIVESLRCLMLNIGGQSIR